MIPITHVRGTGAFGLNLVLGVAALGVEGPKIYVYELASVAEASSIEC